MFPWFYDLTNCTCLIIFVAERKEKRGKMASRPNNNSVKSHQGTVKAQSPNLIFLPIDLGMSCESREPLNCIRLSKNLQGFYGVDNLYLYRHLECFCLKCGLCSNILHRLKDISTLDFLTPSFNPGPFNPRLFNHELYNPDFSTMNYWTMGLKSLGLKSPGLKCHLTL